MKRIGLIPAAIILTAIPIYSQNGTWNQKADIPTARWVASGCELNGKIYVIGGAQTLNSSLNTMEVYDPATDSWDITKTDMPTARAELCVAAVNGKIYAIGGTTAHNGGTVLGVVEEYDPLTDSWVTRAPMLTARKGAACSVINNKIYVAGGSPTTFAPSHILEVYDPATDKWTPKANMPAGRYYPQGTVLNGTFYVSGGLICSPWTGQTAVQIYDPSDNTWSFGTALTTGRVGHTTNSINGKIYAIGGDKQPPVMENVEEYDPVIETWTVIDLIPSAMISHTSSVYGNEIYVFSGSTTNINNLNLTSNVYSYTPPPPVSIPDTAFLNALIEQGVDTNGDSLISFEEAEALTDLDVSDRDIVDMTGIEAFINLDTLDCSANLSLTKLDVSKNTALKYLNCCGVSGGCWRAGQLTSLDVSGCHELVYLNCRENQLTNLDLTNNTTLEYLYCCCNNLIALDISGNTALIALYCTNNSISSLDVSENTALTELLCGGNQLTSMDVSNNIALLTLEFGGNQITSLNVSSNAKLTGLYCGDNRLTSLDISNNSALQSLNCARNQLTSLNVSNNTALEYMYLVGIPTLYEVCVWQMPFPPADVDVHLNGSPNVYFTTNCIYDNNVFIPDIAFLNTLIEKGVDTNSDRWISYSEAEAVGSLYISNNEICNMTGIEQFINLDTLICETILLERLVLLGNHLTSLDVSGCASLTELWCSNNQLTKLDVSNNAALKELYCQGNQITSLDVSNNSALTYLACGRNQLSSLDISDNILLEYLYCCSNKLTSLDVSNNIALIGLFCGNNLLTFLDISKNAAIGLGIWETALDIKNMPSLYEVCVWTMPFPPEDLNMITAGSPNVYFTTECNYDNDSIVFIPDTTFLHALIEKGVDTNEDSLISYSEAEAITYLDVFERGISDMKGIEAFINLETLGCDFNKLIGLDISNNTMLTGLGCGHNQLTSLDISNNTALEWIQCGNNQLTNLDVSNNTALQFIDCEENQLTSLDASKNTALTYLRCWGNKLNNLDASNNSNLVELDCRFCELTELDVSNNPDLKHLYCGTATLDRWGMSCNNFSTENTLNKLTSLNISKCSVLEELDCSSNPIASLDITNCTSLLKLCLCSMDSLYEVCVSTLPFPPVGIEIDTTGSPYVYFTAECTIGIEEQPISNISIYPNPINTILTIETGAFDQYNIEVISLNGQLVYSKKMEGTTHQINLSFFQKGIYFITIRSRDFVITRKIIKL